MTGEPENRPALPTVLAVRQWLYEHREDLPMFTITDHPADFPDYYVARLHLALPTPTAHPFAFLDPELEPLQIIVEALGLTNIGRQPEDDPAIIEVWI
jgi:hypothetical protein